MTRRGGAALVVALAMLALLGFVALVVDLGYARLVHGQLQAAADAAALAGTERLNRTTEGLEDARATAVAIGAMNAAHGQPVSLDPNEGNAPLGDVVLGEWAADTDTFTPSTDPLKVNAVQVLARNDGLAPLFSRVLGKGDLGVAASSTATVGPWQGAGAVPYYLPFCLPDCLFLENADEALQDMTFVLNPAGEDNTGWCRVGGSPNTAWVRDHLDLAEVCMTEWDETGAVSEECTPAETDTDVGLNNGELTAGLKDLLATLEESGLPWDADAWGALPLQHAGSDVAPAAYGNMLVGPLPVFDGGDVYCDPGGGGWTGSAPMTGFVWGAIYDIRWKGSAANQNIWARIDVENVHPIGEWTGGEDYNVVAPGPPWVVQ